jgi:hypothetical protein
MSVKQIRDALEKIHPENPPVVHDRVAGAFKQAGIPFERSLQTSSGVIDFLVDSIVVQVENTLNRGSEEFKRLGILLESHGFSTGILLSSRCRRPFETEWFTREARSLPVQILPIRANG